MARNQLLLFLIQEMPKVFLVDKKLVNIITKFHEIQ